MANLVKSTTRNLARILLNELVEGFYLTSQLEQFIDLAAIDLSTKTFCYERTGSVSLVTSTQLYSLPTDCHKLLGAVHNHHGLKRATPWMEGLHSAVQTGAPEFFFDFTSQIGLFPIPTVTENATVLTLYYAAITNNISNIPLKFQIPAVLYVVFLGLLKAQQYAKAGQVYNIYVSYLQVDTNTTEIDRIDTPQPEGDYVLKLTRQQQ